MTSAREYSMTTGPAKTPQTIGFLTVAEHAQGLFGGYLLLNLLGRPLEFHCTTPVKPNRAQEILYGPTLAPYLYGELIGQTLVAKASHKPLVALTDLAPVLALRNQSGIPVALVNREDASDARSQSGQQLLWRSDPPHVLRGPALTIFRWGANELAVEALHGGDRELVLQRLQGVSETFDLAEPFARIREAIEEAQRGNP
jgi:hypothetical protein